ncbi:beta-lactamase domain-containing protein 2-like [Mytilus edulis]|uniref:beta-lactamase domain-containing protein 2-like n=1 Tax=Mytilus edulis TaxID=6550 RepID=UPI0039EFE42A
MSTGKNTVFIVILAFILYYFKNIFEDDLPPVVEGFFLPEFRSVAELFRNQVENHKEKGGNFAVYYKGELVIDLWGGYADRDSHQRWKNDTLATLFSTTKGVAAILAAKLVDKGHLDYKELVSHYWPGFESNGKDNVTVEMLLSHQAGLSYMDEKLTLNDVVSDPEKLRKTLGNERPKWPPGTGFAYHGITFGFYIDQLLQLADPQKRRVDKLLIEEIAKPFNLELYIGLPKCEVYRTARFELVTVTKYVAKLIFTPSLWKRLWIFLRYPDSIATKGTRVMTDPITNDPARRCIPLSSFNGHGNARSLAKLYGILANGGKDKGKTLMSLETIRTLFSPIISGHTLDLGEYEVLGRGLAEYHNTQGDICYGHPGYGGQMGFSDVKDNIGMAYLTNDLSVYGVGNDPKFLALQRQFYKALEQNKK